MIPAQLRNPVIWLPNQHLVIFVTNPGSKKAQLALFNRSNSAGVDMDTEIRDST